ncbi:MAG: metallophosphoesterase [Verrucomicrobiales bacterium]
MTLDNRFSRTPTKRPSRGTTGWCAAFAVALAAALAISLAPARDLTFHGPILQWHRDPATSVAITWVERIAPEALEAPVWRDGLAGFGYGDDDDRTELPNMKDNYERIYLANTFDLASVPEGVDMRLVIRYDDAFVAWINGTEIARSPNIKGHHAAADVKDWHEAQEAETFVVKNPRRFLKEGKNLIAIEGHNRKISSSDLTIDPVLMLGNRAVVPEAAEWKYLAGTDPPVRWFLYDPSVPSLPELPKAEESEWTAGIRPRRSNVPFEAVKIDERELASTGNPVFEAKVDGLVPDTEYEYVLMAEGREVKKGWFRTAPAVLTRPLKFVVGGDMGTSTAVPVCILAGNEDPLFALIGGDLAYANGTDAHRWYDWLDNWTEFIVGDGGRDIPIIAAIGNHEKHGYRVRRSDAPFYFSLFDLPRRQTNFTVDFGDYMSIVVVDSNHAKKVKAQTLWLNGQLNRRKDVPHLFAIYHRPAWGTGIKGNVDDIQDHWCPLFEKYGVDCVFENDHHVYKRTKKIVGGVPNEEEGVVYIGDGAWGARLRPITERGLERVGGRRYLETWASRHHLVTVTIDPDGMKHYRAKAPGGEVFDSYDDRGTPPAATGLFRNSAQGGPKIRN